MMFPGMPYNPPPQKPEYILAPCPKRGVALTHMRDGLTMRCTYCNAALTNTPAAEEPEPPKNPDAAWVTVTPAGEIVERGFRRFTPEDDRPLDERARELFQGLTATARKKILFLAFIYEGRLPAKDRPEERP